MAVFFLTSALIITAVLAIRFLFKNKLSFLILYPLWGLVLLRLLVPVNIIESPVSILNLANILSPDNKETSAPATMQADTPGTSLSNTKNQNIKKTGKNININKTTTDNKIIIPEKNQEPAVENIQDSTQKTKAAPGKQNQAHNNIITKLGIIIWISGSTIFFIFVIISNTMFYKKLKTNRKHVHTNSKGIPVYTSDIVNTPCLTGILHPAVYLPSDINISNISLHLSSGNIQDKYLKQVLAHEYTHIKHKDNIWSLMRIICLGIYWFNPFVWVAAFYSKQDAELACDEAVLKNCTNDEKYDYGRMLLTMSQKDRQNKLCLATSLGSSKNNLKERITMLTKKRNLKKYQIALIAGFSVIIAGCGMTNGKTVPANNNKAEMDPVTTTIPVATETNIPANNTPNPSEDERIKAFEEFMKKDILSCPEWSKFKGSTDDLYFSIQYNTDNIPCLFVTDRTFEISDTDSSSSYAYVYYYDTESQKTELLIRMACSSSGESVSVADGIFMTDTHHSYTTYSFNSKDNINTLVSETIEGYYMNTDETGKLSDNFTYTKYEFELPFNNKTRKNIADNTPYPYENYAKSTSSTPHYSVPDALDFAKKWDEAVPVTYYKNKKNKWNKFYKDGYITLSYTYAYSMYYGNIDKTISKSMDNIQTDDLTHAEKESSVIINGTRMSYCGKLSEDTSLYYLNNSNGANAILIYTSSGIYSTYNLYGIKKSQNLKSSGTPADIIAETGMPEFINADFDNDGEDETAFYIKDNLYIIDYQYDYSYEDYGIISSSIYDICSFTKEDARYFTEQLCMLYDNNPEQLGTEILNKIKTKTDNKNCKSKINIISNNGYKDYGYILSDNSLENEYGFGNLNSYSITLENGKPQIRASIGITYNKKGETEKHNIKLESLLLLNKNGKFELKEPFSFNKEN